jgi:hypothetical protein
LGLADSRESGSRQFSGKTPYIALSRFFHEEDVQAAKESRYAIRTVLLPDFLVCFVVSCATLPADFERPDSYALPDTGDTTFGRGSVKR